MTIKRIILGVLTVVALIPLLLNLIGSVNQPQVQANLQLYQTNLILQASELNFEVLSDSSSPSNADSNSLSSALLGNDPYFTAQTQYEEAKKLGEKNLSNLKEKLKQISEVPLENEGLSLQTLLSANNLTQAIQLQEEINQQEKTLNKIDLKIGLIKAVRGETHEAIATWNRLTVSEPTATTATVLRELWSNQTEIPSIAETVIEQNLQGWFHYTALKQYYQKTNQKESLLNLETEEQEIALQSASKLALISGIPVIGGLIGVGLLIFLLVQLLIKQKQALLALTNEQAWETPWGGETIWQVLIVGFVFIGQILLPLLFGIGFGFLNINPNELSLRFKAVYVLASYLTMAVGGILVLYLSIKSYFPIPKDWFRFRWLSNWIFWGLGGYLVAIPLVVIVSLINQKIWQGQGGSNPLLMLALESQDTVALIIFFFTAAIAAPLFEEIMFRGFLLPSLTRYMPVWGAIVVSGLIFAVAHLNLSEVIPLATLGIILGVVYTRSRNLLSSILLHSLWNSGTLLSLFILGSSAG
ncbi:Abortive infection protein [Gloeothece citriformis PCC 7424]|uniref:Abortive infection protein n=1 Tax=Gloeothece citriformis (strain PCC 7424) TaxID=65393 RepID=B7KA62_GLOC7|nr:CPBP family intramembrane glutamic endopeptidase [Gloeothece citriformis]ACK71418.1 Abortive infection protein [Gloeothece citriformis PCC 7424]